VPHDPIIAAHALEVHRSKDESERKPREPANHAESTCPVERV
jgi:hypothetical protein